MWNHQNLKKKTKNQTIIQTFDHVFPHCHITLISVQLYSSYNHCWYQVFVITMNYTVLPHYLLLSGCNIQWKYLSNLKKNPHRGQHLGRYPIFSSSWNNLRDKVPSQQMAQNCCNIQPCSLYIALKCFTTSKQQLLCVMLLTPPSILPHVQTEPESTRKQQSNNMLCMSDRGSEREVSLSIYYHFLNQAVKIWMAEGNWTLRLFFWGGWEQKLAETSQRSLLSSALLEFSA